MRAPIVLATVVVVVGLAFLFWPVTALAHGGHEGHRGATTDVAAEAADATEGTRTASERRASRPDGEPSPWLPAAFILSGAAILGGFVVALRRS
jgi:hypothetical protein